MTEESRVIAVCPQCLSTVIFNVEVREVITTRIVEVMGEGDDAEFIHSGESMIHREEREGLPEFISPSWYVCMDCRYEFPKPATARVGEVRGPAVNPRLPEAFRALLRGDADTDRVGAVDIQQPDSSEPVRVDDEHPF